jgi:glycine/D-amino acid oxidase-like deaminating enzyme/nitrite reductase/ring-hydroxylating ferredoxin subunit
MMRRDGHAISLWQEHTISYIPSAKPVPETVYDVIIVGGGITGISTALLLQKAGRKCLVLEAADLCFGTTGGTTAHLNTLLDTPYTTIRKNFGDEAAKLVATATAEAISLIKSNIAGYDIDCGFSETDAFLFAQDEQQEKELADILEASQTAGLDVGYTEGIPVPVPYVKAMRVRGQAKFNPVYYVYGLAQAFEQAGGIIVCDCRVTGVSGNGTVVAETTKGVFTARDLVYATHIPPGINLLHLRCIPYRSYAMAVSLKDDAYPSGLSYDMYDPYHYYRTQEVNGRSYLIAGGEDHKTGEDLETGQCFLRLEAHLRQYFNIDEIHNKWSSQFFESADGLPYIGHLPGAAGHIYVATGFGGNGMVYSSVAAMLLASLIKGEEHTYAQLFDPNRIKPVAGFTNFIQHNAHVVKEFVGKFFSGMKLDQLAELAPGAASVVSYEGRKLALYKDEHGALHAVSPTCTHMKCEVRWNGAEKSWDCPCHGARYNYDGEVLTGPADRGLEPVPVMSDTNL